MHAINEVLRGAIMGGTRISNSSSDIGEADLALYKEDLALLKVFKATLPSGIQFKNVRRYVETLRDHGHDPVKLMTMERIERYREIVGSSERGFRDENADKLLLLILPASPQDARIILHLVRDRDITDPDVMGEMLADLRKTAPSLSEGAL